MPRYKVDYVAEVASKRRADHANENAEDYVELISDLQGRVGAAHVTDVATALGVSHVTVHKTIKRLKALGLVKAEPYRAITLTEEGQQLAIESRRRHEVTLRFLRALGLSEVSAQRDAEGIEHHVGPELMALMEAFVQRMSMEGSVSRSDLVAARDLFLQEEDLVGSDGAK